jgi:hypothetical protein
MPPHELPSRYDVNRNVRMIIARNNADLSRIDYSFTGSTVYLTGDLVKPDGDFSVQEIETLARDISAVPHVRDIQFNLANWMVVSSGDSWQVNRTRKSAAAGRAAHQASPGDSTVVIHKAEKLAHVLEDIKAGSKKDGGGKST